MKLEEQILRILNLIHKEMEYKIIFGGFEFRLQSLFLHISALFLGLQKDDFQNKYELENYNVCREIEELLTQEKPKIMDLTTNSLLTLKDELSKLLPEENG